jgi:hypothetical protein
MYLSKRTSERNAARLFYILKGLKGNKSSFRLEEIVAAATGYKRTQAIHYLNVLCKISWIGLDLNGVYHLRGQQFFFKKFNVGKKCDAQPIPESALTDKKAWAGFISSAMMTATGKAVLNTTTAEQRQRLMLCPNCAESASEKQVPVALSIVSNHTGMSTSTASRNRKRAAESGYIQVKEQLVMLTRNDNVPLSVRSQDMAVFREVHGHSCFLSKSGIVFQQLPSTITLMPTKRIKAK